jgi:hypothetical protein
MYFQEKLNKFFKLQTLNMSQFNFNGKVIAEAIGNFNTIMVNGKTINSSKFGRSRIMVDGEDLGMFSGDLKIEPFSIPSKTKIIEAYEYFFLQKSKKFVVNNVFNRIQRNSNPYVNDKSNQPAFSISECEIAQMKSCISKLSNKNNPEHIAIKLNILKSYGLLNLVKDLDLNLLQDPWKTTFDHYSKNINGNYRDNYYEKVKNGKTENFEKFSVLQEYVFLQNKHLLDRIFHLFPLVRMFVKFRASLKNTSIDLSLELKLNRCVCLFELRIFQVLAKLKLIRIVKESILRDYENLIIRQIQISKELNNLSTYRFALKEYLYVKGLFYHIFKVPKSELINELRAIYELNIDTNYFIDANNLLRFGATFIAPETFNAPFILSTKLTNDYLNLGKVEKK